MTKIVNRATRQDVIVWNESTCQITFYNKTMEVYLKHGIFIPPYKRPEFNGKEMVVLPIGKDPVAFELFIRALKFYYRTEMIKWGVELVEDPVNS